MERSEEQPVARERSGHTAAADGQYLYVWGGYVSVADHEVFLPNDEIWLYDLESGLWERRDMFGEIPPAMSGSCGCIVNEELIIFGGCCDDGQTNEHFSVSLQEEKLSWRKARLRSGSLPSPRDKLSCWVHNGRIIYFGGYGHKLLSEFNDPNRFIVDEASWAEDIFWGWNNEVHEFDPKRSSWTEPQTFGRAPAPRAAHASATIGSKGYVCGGRIKETRTNDLFCLDLNSWTWTEIVGFGSAPVGRSWHTLTAVSDSSLFLFGGLSVDCRPMSDGWIFNLETKGWTKIEHQNKDKPRSAKTRRNGDKQNKIPRLWHTACQGRDSDVIVFGGSHDYILLVDKGHCNDALVFQTQPLPLTRLCQDFIASRASSFQILGLPPKLRNAVQKRTSFFRTSRNSQNM
ncbi:kelch domain-containing protein 1 isoform X2 [Puntigrus tetrazona]|uniref:kelch domain-containing protein 1 isoform X2 n=1 Tax=Puntigrus tetrazona TaxID=1606681 RepID=UPI001C8AEBC9|nr:kelch domain-containing protein 1 isoform X2 [Puntigrus tetrazona]